MEQQINTLPVLDKNNPSGIILEDNEDSEDETIQVLIAPPITLEAIIIEDDNNNNNDDNDNNGYIPGVQDNIGNPGLYDANEVSYNDNNTQTPGVKAKTAGVDAEIAGVAQVIDKVLANISIDEYKDSNNTSYE